MWNIMKAQWYQIKGDNMIIYGILAAFLLPVLPVVFDGAGMDDMTGGMFAVSAFGMIPFALVLLSVILVSRICGWDMNDKTINYELMSGHSRGQIYFGRAIVSIVCTLIAGIAIMVLPTALITMIKGWGDNVAANDMLVRTLVILCPYIRWICELILLVFLVKNSNIALVLGWLLFVGGTMAEMILYEAADITLNVQFASTNMEHLSQITNAKDELVNGELISVFDAALKTSEITKSVAVSLLVAVLCTVLGYAVFKKQDL
ncbi:MAG: ABC transporter permease [Clostridium sp.]|nr:ABC transporter permease [Clostridium sp.]MCM1399445.1 ABC transporter permease [Clostridium sp.]MCM1459999.1 ABC transporter permease [Bacteroides sp.]